MFSIFRSCDVILRRKMQESIALRRAYVSANKVLHTIRLSFFEHHIKGVANSLSSDLMKTI